MLISWVNRRVRRCLSRTTPFVPTGWDRGNNCAIYDHVLRDERPSTIVRYNYYSGRHYWRLQCRDTGIIDREVREDWERRMRK